MVRVGPFVKARLPVMLGVATKLAVRFMEPDT
jgi:hypothetical protein